MKKFFTIAALALSTMAVMAVPARRNQVVLTQPDGSTLTAIFSGDEFMHFYVSAETGTRLTQDAASGYWRELMPDEEEAEYKLWNELRESRIGEMRKGSREEAAKPVHSIGKHRHLTVLIDFPDLKFSEQGTKERFNDMFNGESYFTDGAWGSVRSYFIDQSYGKYDPHFDIVGPITADKSYTYYGENKSKGTGDLNARSLMQEIAEKLISGGYISQTDLNQYDNDGDGYVDLIYFLYAGYSEADGAGAQYIWPHHHSLAQPLTYGSTKISSYSCSSELGGVPSDAKKHIDGIGTITHEFGHALGLPDYYSTSINESDKYHIYGMDNWSIMDNGCYNNRGKTPCSYTAFDRYLLNWIELEELPASGSVELPAITLEPKAYILRNPKNYNEFLVFENHQRFNINWSTPTDKTYPQQGWDAYYGFYTNKYDLASLHGMLVTHVDYNAADWKSNKVNTIPGAERCRPLPMCGELVPYKLYYSTSDATKRSEYSKQYTLNLRKVLWPGVAEWIDPDNLIYSSYTEVSKATNKLFVWHTGESIDYTFSNIYESDLDENKTNKLTGIIYFEVNKPDTIAGKKTIVKSQSKKTIKTSSRTIELKGHGVEESTVGDTTFIVYRDTTFIHHYDTTFTSYFDTAYISWTDTVITPPTYKVTLLPKQDTNVELVEDFKAKHSTDTIPSTRTDTIVKPTAIQEIVLSHCTITAIYNLGGHKLPTCEWGDLKPGSYIVKTTDGKSRLLHKR